MKKIFSLFTAILFAGSMMAAEVTVSWTATTGALGSAISSEGGTASGTIATKNGTEISYDWSYKRTLVTLKSGKSDYVSMSGSYMQLGSSNAGESVEFRTSNIPGTIKSVKVLLGSKDSRHTGTITVGGTDYNAGDIPAWANSAGGDWEGTGSSSGEIVISIDCNSKKSPIYIASITVVYEESADPSVPSISAPKMNFKTVTITSDKANYELDTVLVVTGANLTEAITATGSTHVTVSGELTAEGGNLGLHIVAAPGNFSEKITLTSGETTTEVEVVGVVKQKIIFPGEDATMTAVSSAMEVTVNGINGIKAGTGSAGGSLTVTVPANANKLHFFAAAWKGEAGDITISAPEGVLSVSSVSVKADDGISGGGSAYVLSTLDDSDCAFHLDLTGVAEETEITFSRSGSNQRFVVWGAKYETSGGATAIDNTEATVKAVKFVENGQLFIEKNGHVYNVQGQIVK